MLITVITVAWNAGATIADTCRSVDAQTGCEVEHLVVDGASKDDTLQVLATLPNPCRVVHSEPDRGLYDAMNKGIAKARGDAVGFLNADDRYHGATVLAAVAEAFASTGADAVYVDIDMVEQVPPHHVQRRWRTGRPARWKVLLGWHMPHPGLYVRREVLAALGPFDTRLRIAADYDLMLRLMLKPGIRLHYLPITGVDMAVGGLSTSGLRASWRGYRESAQALRRHMGVLGYLVALAKPTWKLPQWWFGWRSRRAAGPGGDRA